MKELTCSPQLLKNQFVINKFDFKTYLRVLSYYWAKEYEKASLVLTESIFKSQRDEEKSLYYRLWIEILAEKNDYASLSLLLKHLTGQKKSGITSAQTRLSLRGLVHLELDEWEACLLILPYIKNKTKNAYCLEFEQRVMLRLSNSEEKSCSLLLCKKPLVDYFHWCSLLKGLVTLDNKPLCHQVLGRFKTIFAKSPFSLLVDIYFHIDASDMSKALSLSKKLHHRYSDQESYLFLYSVLQLSEGEYKKAIKTLLSDTKKMTPRTSPTYYELLGYSHYLGLKQPTQAKDKHNARDYFTKSRIALCSQGLFSPGCSDLLSPVELNQARVGDKNKDIPIKSSHVEGHTWLVNLSSRRFYEIAHREEKSIDALVYMLGPKAKPQDIVFFATNTLSQNKKIFRLSAAYIVDSPPVWSISGSYESSLRLIRRFQYFVQVQLNTEITQDDCRGLPKTSGIAGGIYQLKKQGLKKMVRALQLIYEKKTDRDQELDVKLVKLLKVS